MDKGWIWLGKQESVILIYNNVQFFKFNLVNILLHLNWLIYKFTKTKLLLPYTFALTLRFANTEQKNAYMCKQFVTKTSLFP